ncbi:hypothetical protein ABMC89_06600 [Sulfitobacter sp. HNIBRBA3233]|uniref:hypothetical protein n=1 Tax=Sulfitobacter marinivivus TaxID=3158558 RepID=UPI0032DFE378
MTGPDPFDLEDLLAAARAAPPRLSDAAAARVLDSALAHQPRAALWPRLLRAIGGPVGLGGLVAATVAGAWIGIAPPADRLDPLALLDRAGVLAQDQELTGLYSLSWDLEEG